MASRVDKPGGLKFRPRTKATALSLPRSSPEPSEAPASSATPADPERTPVSVPVRRTANVGKPTPIRKPNSTSTTHSFASVTPRRPSAGAPAPTFATPIRAPSVAPSAVRVDESPATEARPSTSAAVRHVEDEEEPIERAHQATRPPSKPPTAYALFSLEIRPRVADEAASPRGQRFNIAQEVRARWNRLDDTSKKTFRDEAIRRKHVYEQERDEWIKLHPDLAAHHAAVELDTLPAAPKTPFALFKEHVLSRQTPAPTSGTIAMQWRALPEEERRMFVSQADNERRTYEALYEEWKRNNPDAAQTLEAQRSLTTTGSKKRTVSDDEAEYQAEAGESGAHLQERRINSSHTSMSELSTKSFAHGRASQNTFYMERKLRDTRRERARQLKRMRSLGLPSEDEPSPAQVPAPDASTSRHATPVQEDEGAMSGAETSEAASDAESVGAASSHHVLRERKFAVRTRVVDGRIVLDESSLQQSRNNDSEGATGEAIDVNESDRFVTSATHVRGRQRNDRWTAPQTERFLEAVSMWGSDFEMIARMFPNRDRRQIRAKWRSMERTDPSSLNMAFRRKLPVDLSVYGDMAGVDLSGEAPPIEIKQIIKKPDEDEDEDREQIGEPKSEHPPTPPVPVQRDENGLEIVEEGDDDDEQLPPSIEPRREDRATSVASATSTSAVPVISASRRGRSSSTATGGVVPAIHGASSAAATDRDRKMRREREEQRAAREMARRRPPASGEEEVLD